MKGWHLASMDGFFFLIIRMRARHRHSSRKFPCLLDQKRIDDAVDVSVW